MKTCQQFTSSGCNLAWDRKGNPKEILYCPLHAKAPEMRFELQTTMEDVNTVIDNSRMWRHEQLVKHLMEVQRRIGALLREIEGKGVTMSHQKDREEFIALMAYEGVSLDVARRLLRHAATLQRIAELECSSEAADKDRVRCPAEVSDKYECCCDFGYQTPGEHSTVPRVSAQSKRIEFHVWQLCKQAGLKPVFSGDPRGAVVKLVVPSGKTNDWGQTGLCVPA